MSQRDAAHVDMRLRHGRGLGNDDMGVDVDRRRGRAPGKAVGVMDAGGGAAIAIFAVDHLV